MDLNVGRQGVKNHLRRQASPDLLVVICTPVETHIDRGMDEQHLRSLRLV
ncbi:hypothetical protein [Laspinema olomoucense]|nr:hypothetical protein [Laspinema sp. D3d]MCT7973560.1 hypothetical protein [Laspinema sp. D3d]